MVPLQKVVDSPFMRDCLVIRLVEDLLFYARRSWDALCSKQVSGSTWGYAAPDRADEALGHHSEPLSCTTSHFCLPRWDHRWHDSFSSVRDWLQQPSARIWSPVLTHGRSDSRLRLSAEPAADLA